MTPEEQEEYERKAQEERTEESWRTIERVATAALDDDSDYSGHRGNDIANRLRVRPLRGVRR